MYDIESEILMRVGNTVPNLEVTLTDNEGNPVNLDQATVEVIAVDSSYTQVWSGSATVADNQGNTDPDQPDGTGQVSYDYDPSDVATAGNFGLYFHVTFDTGGTTDFPTDGPISFTVAELGAGTGQYVVDITRLARRIGITTLTSDLRQVLEDMVAGVQADVEGYLRRPLMPTRFTELAWADYTEPCGWNLQYDPVINVLSASDPDPVTGLCTVQYVAGITNQIAQGAISRYVYGSAQDEFAAHPVYGKGYRAVKTMSAGGRSISYDEPAAATRRASATLPAYPQPGATPSIETLAAWRKRGVFSRRKWVGADVMGAGFPYYGLGGLSIGGGDDYVPVDGLFDRDPTTGEVTPA